MVSHLCLSVASSRSSTEVSMRVSLDLGLFQPAGSFLSSFTSTERHQNLRTTIGFQNAIVFRFCSRLPRHKTVHKGQVLLGCSLPTPLQSWVPARFAGIMTCLGRILADESFDGHLSYLASFHHLGIDTPSGSFSKGHPFTSRVSISERSHLGRASSSEAQLFFIFRKEFPVRNF